MYRLRATSFLTKKIDADNLAQLHKNNCDLGTEERVERIHNGCDLMEGRLQANKLTCNICVY